MDEDGSRINPLFAVLDPNGTMVAEDNDGGEGRNALISYFVPRMDGTYTIVPDAHGPVRCIYPVSEQSSRPQPITPGEVVRGDTADGTVWAFQHWAGCLYTLSHLCHSETIRQHNNNGYLGANRRGDSLLRLRG